MSLSEFFRLGGTQAEWRRAETGGFTCDLAAGHRFATGSGNTPEAAFRAAFAGLFR